MKVKEIKERVVSLLNLPNNTEIYINIFSDEYGLISEDDQREYEIYAFEFIRKETLTINVSRETSSARSELLLDLKSILNQMNKLIDFFENGVIFTEILKNRLKQEIRKAGEIIDKI